MSEHDPEGETLAIAVPGGPPNGAPLPRLARLTAVYHAIAKQSMVYLAAGAVNTVVPFLALPFFTRWLGPEGYGKLGSVLAMINVAMILIGLNTHGKISVSYFREGAHTLPFQVGASVCVLAATAIPLMLLVQVFGGAISSATSVPSEWLWVVGVSACGQFLVTITLTVWQVQQRPWRYGATQLAFSLSTTGLSLLCVGWLHMGWKGRVLGQALSAALATVVCLILLTAIRGIEWNPRKWPIRGALAFGLPLLPHALAGIAMGTVDRFALSSTLDATATGHYFAAFQIAALLSVGAAALNQAWIPWLYERLAAGDVAAKTQVVRATYLIYAGMLTVAAVLSIGAPEVVRIIGGAKYAASVDLLRYLAPAAAFGGMYYFVTGYLFYAHRTGVLSVITTSVAAVQIGLTFWLVHVDGARGVARAALICAFLYWATTAIVANRIVPMPWRGARA